MATATRQSSSPGRPQAGWLRSPNQSLYFSFGCFPLFLLVKYFASSPTVAPKQRPPNLSEQTIIWGTYLSLGQTFSPHTPHTQRPTRRSIGSDPWPVRGWSNGGARSCGGGQIVSSATTFPLLLPQCQRLSSTRTNLRSVNGDPQGAREPECAARRRGEAGG